MMAGSLTISSRTVSDTWMKNVKNAHAGESEFIVGDPDGNVVAELTHQLI